MPTLLQAMNMGAIGLTVLLKEIEADCGVIQDAADKARRRLGERLIQRLSLTLPGIRPSFLPKEGVRAVRELKGFRHLVRHAYDLEFDAVQVAALVETASGIAASLPGWTAEFAARTRAEQGWT